MTARDLGWPLRGFGAAWRRRRADAAHLPRPAGERARVPGRALSAEPLPGGGLVRFERSSLWVRVAVGGAVFCGWDGAGLEPSYALAGCPEADARVVLEPDGERGWRVVAERLQVAVGRFGGVEVRTPGGVLLRRELPPRWWGPEGAQPPYADGESGGAHEARGGGAEAESGACEGAAEGVRDAGAVPERAGGRWLQRSEVAADARFFGPHGALTGEAGYRLWNSAGGRGGGPPDGPPDGPSPQHVTMPVQLVVADAGAHLVFHDNSWDGEVALAEGVEGRGSGHDRPGRSAVRMAGGPLRYWVLAGPPARVLHGWTRLTGAPAPPPRWALGHQHVPSGRGGERAARRAAESFRERGLPLRALHLDGGHLDGGRVFTVDGRRFPDLPSLAAELRGQGVRLVSVVHPAVKAERGYGVYDEGVAADAFVRDARGRRVRGLAPAGASVFPDFTDPRVRKWWSGLYEERLAQGFAGVWHELDEPVSYAAFGERTLPRSARHDLEGRGGDHREAHNVYALAMAEAGAAGLRELRPHERPFLFSRAGWAGMQRYGGCGGWSGAGEGQAGWAALRASLARVLGLGLCGVPYCGPDVPLPDGPDDAAAESELLLRGLQLAAYLPLLRTRAVGAGRGGRRRGSAAGGGRAGAYAPWKAPDGAAATAAVLAERARLEPYFATLAQLAHRTGAPYVRPLWWRHPRDRALRDCGDAFLLGDALLVAPALAPGVRERAVRLPRGRWYDTATGAAFEGPGEVRVAAPRERIPVLARAGAAIPVAGPGGGTELEVWPPAPGRTGRGLVIPDAGAGGRQPAPERFTVRWRSGVCAVDREDGGPVGYPVRVRT